MLSQCSGAPTFDAFFRSLRFALITLAFVSADFACRHALCSKGGRVLMLGLPKVPITIQTPLPDFIFKSITLKARDA